MLLGRVVGLILKVIIIVLRGVILKNFYVVSCSDVVVFGMIWVVIFCVLRLIIVLIVKRDRVEKLLDYG